MNWLTLVISVTLPVSFMRLRPSYRETRRPRNCWPRYDGTAARVGELRTGRQPIPAGGPGMETLLWTYASWSTLVIRVVLGIIFFAHGAQKVLGWFGGYGLKGTTQSLSSLGIPLPVAYLVCFFEFLGGIGLIAGLLTRLAALAIVVVMIGAIAKVHWQNGFFLNWSLTPGTGPAYQPTPPRLAVAVAAWSAAGGPPPLARLPPAAR